ncbi:hypothetical protein E8L03_20675 [Oceanidesulfovibrio marinus]|uniref:SbsA Ig-like domain-containing protein n=2 Tax=Oceanidesulfovibrio marinus TaxID=370038 RepID=A0ABX6NKI2_9BACT|nr:hypothetical protein E8L03_20675 [Oceanidesulfovibrio marinus]
MAASTPRIGGSAMPASKTMTIVFLAACLAVFIALPILAADNELPQVASTSPANGAQNVAPGKTELRVTFSKPMRDQSWSWAYEDQATFPQITAQPHYEDGGVTCVLPVLLEPGKSYVIWLNTANLHNFTDEAGNALPPYRWEFHTGK